ncbi:MULTISPECIES: LPS translocon maturation chaperone LptM [Acinetobacter]|uniref:Lipoprotein n=2 Tax=Acinetobacter baylyi TaxID=202950 RepID=Q6F948_ACIAD|nr:MULTISPECIES: lipoprotein [Acinetobacter]ENV53340.1 hypothetical protein F952_02401 [Acinetobacter baylyi DSM 14961 = CIP 107474]KAF2370698.1 hypothetical protein BSL88_08765 [Acinetobacter baylyi]KAF2375163.1 hypothetical protein BSL67_02375 [Acinetobacter baylyi]KAF2378508.1 hypothetical protein BSN81_03655 [Acinetobacter baylyi]KAF2379998.1 hypothetical protein BSN83_11930 [Acinetobacter baylyi]
MRRVICYVSLFATSLSLLGCGQTGALHLPSDSKHDKGAKYLIYSHPEAEHTQKDSAKESAASQPVSSSSP